nr:head-tail adaptor protein [uncultured Celeribacter sp.]
MTGAGRLKERFAFDAREQLRGPGGVMSDVWVERHSAQAEVIYSRGSEVIEAARLEGRAVYKVRIRQCAAARAITADWRARDVRRSGSVNSDVDALPGARYAIREVDTITDRDWVYIVIEGGKAP